MPVDEQVAFAWRHREHFAEVRRYNLDMAAQRHAGNWDNRIRNPWAEIVEQGSLLSK